MSSVDVAAAETEALPGDGAAGALEATAGVDVAEAVEAAPGGGAAAGTLEAAGVDVAGVSTVGNLERTLAVADDVPTGTLGSADFPRAVGSSSPSLQYFCPGSSGEGTQRRVV